MAVTPNSFVTPQTPKSGTSVCTAANTVYGDSGGNYGAALYTAGPNGARITKITATPRGNTAANECQLYRSLDAGTTKRLFRSKLLAAINPTGAIENPGVDFGYSESNALILSPNEVLYPATGVAGTGGVAFSAEGADY